MRITKNFIIKLPELRENWTEKSNNDVVSINWNDNSKISMISCRVNNTYDKSSLLITHNYLMKGKCLLSNNHKSIFEWKLNLSTRTLFTYNEPTYNTCDMRIFLSNNIFSNEIIGNDSICLKNIFFFYIVRRFHWQIDGSIIFTVYPEYNSEKSMNCIHTHWINFAISSVSFKISRCIFYAWTNSELSVYSTFSWRKDKPINRWLKSFQLLIQCA